jgi:hypothetical protein
LNEAGISVLILMKGSKIPRVEHNIVHFNSIIHYSCTMNSSTLDVGIIASVCGLPNSPYLPCWNNIHDTFPTGAAQNTTELLGVRCEVKTRGACIYDEESK